MREFEDFEVQSLSRVSIALPVIECQHPLEYPETINVCRRCENRTVRKPVLVRRTPWSLPVLVITRRLRIK